MELIIADCIIVFILILLLNIVELGKYWENKSLSFWDTILICTVNRDRNNAVLCNPFQCFWYGFVPMSDIASDKKFILICWAIVKV